VLQRALPDQAPDPGRRPCVFRQAGAAGLHRPAGRMAGGNGAHRPRTRGRAEGRRTQAGAPLRGPGWPLTPPPVRLMAYWPAFLPFWREFPLGGAAFIAYIRRADPLGPPSNRTEQEIYGEDHQEAGRQEGRDQSGEDDRSEEGCCAEEG